MFKGVKQKENLICLIQYLYKQYNKLKTMTSYSTLMNIYYKKISADIVCMIIDYNTTIISYKEYFSAMIKMAMDHREYLKKHE